ncbi:MAG: TRAP transporter small permease [Chloroflexi bacterium]|nr:TRAP transporter small permease [Chloroflexota bacterium]
MAKFRRAEAILCNISGIFLFLLAALVTFDVIGRRFGVPVKGTPEISKLLLAVTVWAGVAFVTMVRGHIAIDLFVSHMSPRAQKLTDVIACLFGLFGFFIIFLGNTRTAMAAFRFNEVTDIFQLPIYPLRFMIPLGAAIVLIELSIQLVENLASLIREKGQTA